MKLLLVLGNGFSIDFVHGCLRNEHVDVSNLFSYGAQVKWPANNEPGFLSFRNCPNLWNLGARPTLDTAEATGLIEDVITCANVVASTDKPEFYQELKEQLYVKAYKELSLYLKHLFVFYDKRVQFEKDDIEHWGWAKFFSAISSNSKYSEITIITYNYDIWLERILDTLRIPYSISIIGAANAGAKINILKPHGSISFTHEKCGDKIAFNIPHKREIHNAEASTFDVNYDDLDNNYFMNAMIPPAGDSSRLNHSWATTIREEAKRKASEITKDDMAIICGLSYWHVDRPELDELMVKFNPDINLKMINPNPPRAMSAVLTSLFRNYVQHVDSSILEELVNV